MKCYFDNRNNDGISLIVCLDGQLYDKLFLRKNAINLIELPDGHKELKISFKRIYEKPEKIERTIVDELPVCIEYIPSEEINKFDKSIRFPYEQIIGISEYDDELVFHPVPIETDKVKGIFYFEAVNAADGKRLSMKLRKLNNINTEKVYKDKRYMFLVGIILSIAIIIAGIRSIYILKYGHYPGVEYGPSQSHMANVAKLAVLGPIYGPMILIYSIVMLIRTLAGKETYKEDLLENELYIARDGRCSASHTIK